MEGEGPHGIERLPERFALLPLTRTLHRCVEALECHQIGLELAAAVEAATAIAQLAAEASAVAERQEMRPALIAEVPRPNGGSTVTVEMLRVDWADLAAQAANGSMTVFGSDVQPCSHCGAGDEPFRQDLGALDNFVDHVTEHIGMETGGTTSWTLEWTDDGAKYVGQSRAGHGSGDRCEARTAQGEPCLRRDGHLGRYVPASEAHLAMGALIVTVEPPG